MPSLSTTTALLLALAPITFAANTVKFLNHCPYPLYFWTVGPADYESDSSDAAHILVPSNGGSAIHTMQDSTNLDGGMTLKLRDYPYYNVAPAGIIQIEYNLEMQRQALWYDLSAIDCDHGVGPEHPGYCREWLFFFFFLFFFVFLADHIYFVAFMAGGMSLRVANAPSGECPSAHCSKERCDGTYMTHDSYLDEPSFWCGAGADLLVETCKFARFAWRKKSFFFFFPCVEGGGVFWFTDKKSLTGTEGAGQQTFHGKGPNASSHHKPPFSPYPGPKPPSSPVPDAHLTKTPNGECK